MADGGNMAAIVFWEKPGCQGNAKQKEILRASGHEVDVRDLLTEPWDAATLELFFGTRPVAEWFNPSHPLIKSGEIVPAVFAREEALQLMTAEPLFIVRPLMQVGEQRLAGFDVEQVHSWIGIESDSVGTRNPRNCPCLTEASSTGQQP
jgi:nitrogenase-associated protein